MNTSTSVAAATIAICAAVLTGCGASEAGGDPARGHEADAVRLADQARAYVGDPWEKRYRDQFWARQHIHDSWNPCHIGENVPKAVQGEGSACWSRLRSHTGR
jgi:hypothetical protein